MSFIRFEHVSKTYRSGQVEVQALKDVSFEVESGEICVIVGQSGAGKTTLLNILGGMDTLTGGTIVMNGQEVSALTNRQRAGYRRTEIGFVFQFYNLIPNLTALENVEIAAQLVKEALPAQEVLERVGLADRMGNFPKNPRLLLCDEPTGALDYETGKQILALLQEQSRKNGMTVIIITHNSALTAMADRVIQLQSGTVKSAAKNESPVPVEEIEW